jgi:multiple sugar transport system permease protein/sn-glycerol 3-phosphate transport system permease protein
MTLGHVPVPETSTVGAPGAATLTTWLRNPRRRADLLTAFLFLIPSLLVFGVFVYFAMGFNLYISFTSWNFLTGSDTFVGAKNYLQMVGDRGFWRALRNTFYYATGSVSFSMAIGLLLALLLSQKIRGRNFFRTLTFTPYITTTAAVALLWIWIFHGRYGVLNHALSWVGIEPISWLTNSSWAMPSVILMSVWQSAGYAMLLFLAGLLGIPREYYEAAEIDGAGRWASFRHITLPLLTPTTFFLLVTMTIRAMQVFDSVAVMTRGGPAGATTVLNFYIYEQAFTRYKASYASGVAVILFLIILVLTLIQFRFSNRWVHYES